MCREVWIVVAILGAAGGSCAALANDKATAAGRVEMQIDANLWRPVLFAEAVQPDKAVGFSMAEDPLVGPYVSVGPWRAGRWSARWQFDQRYPSATGRIGGRYRTMGLLPFQACVTVSFYKGGERLAKRRYDLAPRPSWTEFEVQVRCPPEGADSFTAAFGLAEHSEGRAQFAQLWMDEEVTAFEAENRFVRTRRMRPFSAFKRTGRHRVQEFDGAWWFVGPDGIAWYSAGVVGPALGDHEDVVAAGMEASDWIREHGFNSLAGWTNVQRWGKVNEAMVFRGREPMPMFVVVQSNSLEGFDWMTDAAGDAGAEGHRFPDPFDPAFEQAYRTEVQRVCERIGEAAWLVGWFADNELSHGDLFRRVWSEHAAREWINFLKGVYGGIGKLNEAWSTQFESWNALRDARPEPAVRVGRMYEDMLLFERRVVQAYVDVTIRVIREVDPERLIFSNRFMAGDVGAYARVLDLYKAYDGIAVNLYPANREAGLSANERDFLRMFHQLTGRPILVGEWSVPALDSGLYEADQEAPLDWSWNEVVDTQQQRAAQAARVAAAFYDLPFVVGAHWFTWKDYDSPKRRANRGLFRASGEAWGALQEALRTAHQGLR